MRHSPKDRGCFSGLPGCALVFVVVVLLSPWYLWLAACWLVRAIQLRMQWTWNHGRRGKRFLVIYSDSPKSRDYIETRVVPLLQDSAILVNITTATNWQSARSFERRAHRHWAGWEADKPIVLCFQPFWFVRTVRFHEAVLARWHKNDETLLKARLAELRGLALPGADFRPE